MVKDNISNLRVLMREHGLSAYIMPSTDPHASEYMADYWKETEWLTGFKGETCTVLVTLSDAFLWTDSRYYLQAEKELAGTGVALMRESEVDTPSIPVWLSKNLSAGETVGVNAEMFSVKAYNELQSELAKAAIKLHNIDLVKPLWTDRGAMPQSKLYEYRVEYAGESVKSKLVKVRRALADKRCDTMIISALDEIAWLLNVRGSDVEFNPVIISYLLLEKDKCTLFIEPEKLNKEALEYLMSEQIAVQDYFNIYNALMSLPHSSKVLFDGSRLNKALEEAIPVACKRVDTQSPVMLLKSCKNEVEIKGERKAMLEDAVALTRFFRWLETEAFQTKQTEYTLMQKLYELRAERENFVEESFGTIAGYEGNGAIVHYAATESDCAEVKNEGMLLLDSGGQYLDGTTDITRTVWLGSIPQEGDARYEEFRKARFDFTLVLKGHIALATAVFPRGTRGNQLDVLAHQYMWQEGITYGHGTGHGVGHFLGCHEGPQNIRTDNNPAPLQLGNICSDEPGIYRAGEYGIRIENLITVVPAVATKFAEFYKFDTLTLCYYDTRLMDTDMMTKAELEWINSYHENLLKEVCPLLSEDEQEWLKAKCKVI